MQRPFSVSINILVGSDSILPDSVENFNKVLFLTVATENS